MKRDLGLAKNQYSTQIDANDRKVNENRNRDYFTPAKNRIN